MKQLTQAVLALLLVSGCASPPRATDSPEALVRKQEEIHVLQSEIDQLIRALDRFQQDSSRNIRSYSSKARERDLNDAIAVLGRARDRLSAQQAKLRSRYSSGPGPY
jgi:outer membrane murein-binding lipoprotein Lpp